MERPVSFAAEDIRDEKVCTVLDMMHDVVITYHIHFLCPRLGQGPPCNFADRARAHTLGPIRGCQRETRLPR